LPFSAKEDGFSNEISCHSAQAMDLGALTPMYVVLNLCESTLSMLLYDSIFCLNTTFEIDPFNSILTN